MDIIPKNTIIAINRPVRLVFFERIESTNPRAISAPCFKIIFGMK